MEDLLQDETRLLKAVLGDRLPAFATFRVATRTTFFDSGQPDIDQIDCPLQSACTLWSKSRADGIELSSYEQIAALAPTHGDTEWRIFLSILFFELLKSRAARKGPESEKVVEMALLSVWRSLSQTPATDLESFFDFITDAMAISRASRATIERGSTIFRELLDHYLDFLYFPLQHIELDQPQVWIPRREKFVRFTIDEWVIGQFTELGGIDVEDYGRERFLCEQKLGVLIDFLEEAVPYSAIVSEGLAARFITPWKALLVKKGREAASGIKLLEQEDVRMFVLFSDGEVRDVKKGQVVRLKGKSLAILSEIAAGDGIDPEALRKRCECNSLGALHAAISELKKLLRDSFSSDIFHHEDGKYSLLAGVSLFAEKARTPEHT